IMARPSVGLGLLLGLQMGERLGRVGPAGLLFLCWEFSLTMLIPEQLWAEQASSSEQLMAAATGFRRQAEQRVTSTTSALPTQIPGQLLVNLGRSLEPRTEGAIGCHSQVEQPNCSPAFRLSTLITELPLAFSESSSERRMEETPG